MDIKIHLLITFEQKNCLVWASPKNGQERLPQKILNLTPKRRKRRRQKENGKKAYGRMWSPRWKLGGQTSLEIACRDCVLSYVTERLHTFTWFDPGPLVICRASCLCPGGETTPLNCDHQRTHCSYPDDICVWSNSIIIIIIIIITKSWGTNG
jgi:hypothetical protein